LKKLMVENLVMERESFENEIPGGNYTTIGVNNSRA
jgi:hypothetical protein